MKHPQNPELMISDLYPHLNQEEQKEAEENLERYLELVLRIYNRIYESPETALTDPRRKTMI
jgi:hypothetical protein